jgi:hypothetical protein
MIHMCIGFVVKYCLLYTNQHVDVSYIIIHGQLWHKLNYFSIFPTFLKNILPWPCTIKHINYEYTKHKDYKKTLKLS